MTHNCEHCCITFPVTVTDTSDAPVLCPECDALIAEKDAAVSASRAAYAEYEQALRKVSSTQERYITRKNLHR